MARFNVEIIAMQSGEKYQIRDTETGELVSCDGATVWSNHAACFGWANKCNRAGHIQPRPEHYRNPYLGLG